MNIIDKIFKKKYIEVDCEVFGASLFLNWKPVKNADYYKIFIRLDDDFVEYGITSGVSVRIDFLKSGENYIVIKAYSGDNIIKETETIKCLITQLDVNYTVSGDRTHIFWNKVKNAEGYKIYKNEAENYYVSCKDIKTTDTYLYFLPQDADLKIRPYKIKYGEMIYLKPNTKFLVRKDDVLAESDRYFDFIVKIRKSGADIFWKPVKGATSYKILYSSSSYSDLQEISKTLANEFTLSYLPYGMSYISVKAFYNDECIAESLIRPVNVKHLEVFPVNTDKKILLYWNKVKGYDGYRIFKKNENGEYSGFKSADKEEVYIKEVSAGEECEFKVKPYKLVEGKREFPDISGKCSVTVYKTSHIQLFINEAFGNKISLSWLFEGDVDGFTLYRNGSECMDIHDGLSHILLHDYTEDEFQIKGYKYFYSEKVYTCESFNKSINDKTNRLNQKCPDKYKLSVIIPAYNSEDYISRSISTVLGSDLQEIELIVVDDGSKDNTRDIISWYAEKYPHIIKKIFKENGGVADTRNKGIEAASGEYITFMDNDDMIRPYGYTALYNAIIKTGADIAVAPLFRIDIDRYVPRHKLLFPENAAIPIEDYLKLIYSDGYNNIGVWNKIYRTDMVKAHPFGILAYEDVSWTPYILSYADTFCYVNKFCYEWDRKIRPETFSNVLSNRSAEEKFEERYQAFRFFLDKGNPKRKECLYYIMAKRLYNQGMSAKYHGYFDAISDMKEYLINNKFLLEDELYTKKLAPYLK